MDRIFCAQAVQLLVGAPPAGGVAAAILLAPTGKMTRETPANALKLGARGVAMSRESPMKRVIPEPLGWCASGIGLPARRSLSREALTTGHWANGQGLSRRRAAGSTL